MQIGVFEHLFYPFLILPITLEPVVGLEVCRVSEGLSVLLSVLMSPAHCFFLWHCWTASVPD